MSNIFVGVDPDTGVSYYKAAAWVAPDEVQGLSFHAGPARKITRTDPRAPKELTFHHEMYATKPVTVERTVGGSVGTMSNLCLKDVRILYQSSMNSGNSSYGMTFVRFAFPTTAVEAIRKALMKASDGKPIDTAGKSQVIAGKDGQRYTVFTGNIANIDISYAPSDGDDASPQLADLKTLLSDAQADVIASVVLKVDLKYGGADAEDTEDLRYSLAFAPTYIQPRDVSEFALDPSPAGLTKIREAEVPDGVVMGDRMAALIKKINLRGGSGR